MNYSLSNMLSRRSVFGTLDPDAAAYIAAVRVAGGTVTGAQEGYINTFVLDEKSASRWTLHKRIYLPIWGVSSANAICMKSLTTGTFFNSPTMGAGFVQGNGVSQYFDTNASISGMGLDGSSLLWGGLINQANSNSVVRGIAGAYENETAGPYLGINTSIQLRMYNAASNTSATLATNGILLGGVDTGNFVIRRRNSSGYSTLASVARSVSGTLPTRTVVFMAINNLFWFSDARFGSFFVSAGMSSANSEAFTLNLKTLWESSTGLTLP